MDAVTFSDMDFLIINEIAHSPSVVHSSAYLLCEHDTRFMFTIQYAHMFPKICMSYIGINYCHIPLQYITYGQNAMEPPASSRTPTIATTTTATITTTASILTTTKSTTVTTPVSAIKPIAKAAPKVNCFMMYSLLYASKHYLLQNNNNFSVSRFANLFVVSPTRGGGETKGSKCRPSVIRRKCKVKVKGHLRSNVKIYLQDSLVTNNSQPLNAIVTKLGSQMHLGNRHAMLPSVVTC